MNVSANCLLALINMPIATSESTATDKSNWGDLAREIAYVWMDPTFELSTGDIYCFVNQNKTTGIAFPREKRVYTVIIKRA